MTNQFVLDNRFCCAGFQHLVLSAGQRGLACLVIQRQEGNAFCLQSRGVAFEDEHKLRAVPEAPDFKINISSESGLRFCPFCGRKLQDLVAANPEAFNFLAEEHRKFRTVDL
jgi:hypothetical protein